MKLLRIYASVNLWKEFSKLIDISNEEIEKGTWVDRVAPELFIDIVELEVIEATLCYFTDDGKVYREQNEDSDDELCIYTPHYPKTDPYEVSAIMYVLEGEELKGKKLLANYLKASIARLIHRCNIMRDAIDRAKNEWE